METFLREYRKLKQYPVVGADRQALAALLFDRSEWRVRELCLDLERPLLVDVAAIERLVDSPPQLLLRGGEASDGASDGGAARGPSIHAPLDDLLQREVLARDGAAGRVTDLLVNTRHWLLRYFVVTHELHSVLLHVRWTSGLDGSGGLLVTSLPAEAIRSAPEYRGLAALSPGDECVLYRHYTSRDFHPPRGAH